MHEFSCLSGNKFSQKLKIFSLCCIRHAFYCDVGSQANRLHLTPKEGARTSTLQGLNRELRSVAAFVLGTTSEARKGGSMALVPACAEPSVEEQE
ncbi:MAG: hypothetical protein EBT13_06160 [Rhodobacteraceae bacterium]|nr:hypothetical protein [Paracoccaceae bacterium]